VAGPVRPTSAECLSVAPLLEELWEQARSPKELLQLLPEDDFSERKRRLFLVACFRRIEDILPDQLSREAIALAERQADGEAAAFELNRIAEATWDAFARGSTWETLLMESLNYLVADPLPNVISQAEQIADFIGARPTYHFLRELPLEERFSRKQPFLQAEAEEQAQLLRDIVGNPFHYDPTPLERDLLLHPDLLTWQDGRLEQVAGEIYRAREFERLPELADLLQAAGCSDTELVRHCRQHAAHVRGCWVVDVLLGKS
jgi:hypothetical protein